VNPTPVLVSAHRGGAGTERDVENTRVAVERAIELGVDYVEFDVRRCGDGTLVLVHDDWVLVNGRPRPVAELTFEEFASRAPHFLSLDAALELVAGRAGAHLDLKFRSPDAAYADPAGTREVAATARAVEVLGAEGVLVTTGNVRAIRAVRDWSDASGLDVLAGLTVGGSVAGRKLRQQASMRRAELSPAAVVTRSRANAVVANHWLARAAVARFARRAGLPLVVWTVDDPVSLRYWLRPGRAWLVTTNHPRQALAIRDGRIKP
jgi:glycerophosphoryl diester phosphodiesterase